MRVRVRDEGRLHGARVPCVGDRDSCVVAVEGIDEAGVTSFWLLGNWDAPVGVVPAHELPGAWPLEATDRV